LHEMKRHVVEQDLADWEPMLAWLKAKEGACARPPRSLSDLMIACCGRRLISFPKEPRIFFRPVLVAVPIVEGVVIAPCGRRSL